MAQSVSECHNWLCIKDSQYHSMSFFPVPVAVPLTSPSWFNSKIAGTTNWNWVGKQLLQKQTFAGTHACTRNTKDEAASVDTDKVMGNKCISFLRPYYQKFCLIPVIYWVQVLEMVCEKNEEKLEEIKLKYESGKTRKCSVPLTLYAYHAAYAYCLPPVCMGM